MRKKRRFTIPIILLISRKVAKSQKNFV